MLIGWIGVEFAFIRSISFFHPVYAAIGAAFVVAGRRRPNSSRRAARRAARLRPAVAVVRVADLTAREQVHATAGSPTSGR